MDENYSRGGTERMGENGRKGGTEHTGGNYRTGGTRITATTDPTGKTGLAGETGLSPKDLARLSGVSVRTLHHYDNLGLLVPRRLSNGYRSYSRADVARLQQILLLRECGMALADIGRVLGDPKLDMAAVLREHLTVLEGRRTELELLLGTVRATIDELEGRRTMTDEERFCGLRRQTLEQNERTYGAEVRRRWGDETADAANARLMALDERGWNDVAELEEAIKSQLRAAMDAGDPTGPEAAELVRMHARWLCAHWPEGLYSPEAHRGMADGYLADERFVAYYDGACGEGATRFLHDAVHALT